MKYTKPWNIQSLAAEDPWHQWLEINALPAVEYHTIYWDDCIEIEFYDEQRGMEFAQEFGL